MKYKITIETDEDFERRAIIDAVKNKVLLDGIYEAVFRPVFKYGDNQDDIDAFEKVWLKLSDYLDK